MVSYKHLKIDDKGNLIISYLSNPPTHTLTALGLVEIHNFLDSLVGNKELRVLAFTGVGEDVFIRHYEVGELADAAEKNIRLEKEANKSDKELNKELHGFHKMLLKIRDLDAIVIAGIHGNTAGGGCEFSLGCDLRVMSKAAIMTTAFARVGFSGDYGGSYFMTQLIGSAKARELYMLSDRVSAEEALDLGLANWICEPEELMDKTMDLADLIAFNPAWQLGEIKRMIRDHQFMDDPARVMEIESDIFSQSQLTDAHKEFLVSFRENRQTNYHQMSSYTNL